MGAAAFSPSGYWVASGDEAGFLRVWSWDHPGHLLKVEVQVFAGAIKDVQWDGESKRIVAVGDGKGILSKCVMWDTGGPRRPHRGARSPRRASSGDVFLDARRERATPRRASRDVSLPFDQGERPLDEQP